MVGEMKEAFQNSQEQREPILLRPIIAVKQRKLEALIRRGSFYRISAGRFDCTVPLSGTTSTESSKVSIRHWLDAIPMLLHFEFTNQGDLLYHNRILLIDRCGEQELHEEENNAKDNNRFGAERIRRFPKALLKKSTITSWNTDWKGCCSTEHQTIEPASLERQEWWRRLLTFRWKKILSHTITPSSREESFAFDCNHSISGKFPLGRYHGQSGKLIALGTGISEPCLQEIDPVTLQVKHRYWLKLNNTESSYSSSFLCPHGVDDNSGRYQLLVLRPKTDIIANYFHSENEDLDSRTRHYFTYIVVKFPKTLSDVEAADSAMVRVCRFKAPPRYVHSFAGTKNYLVVILCPLEFNGNTSSGKMIENLLFKADSDTLIYVISKTEGIVKCVYRSQGCFLFHILQAFECEDDSIVVDANVYESGDQVINYFKMEELLPRPGSEKSTESSKLPLSYLRRFKLSSLSIEMARHDGAAGILPRFPIATFEQLTRGPIEFCQCPGNGRFAYGLTVKRKDRLRPGILWNALVKLDLSQPASSPKRSTLWSEEDSYPSEPVFVPFSASTNASESMLLQSDLSTTASECSSSSAQDSKLALKRIDFESTNTNPTDPNLSASSLKVRLQSPTEEKEPPLQLPHSSAPTNGATFELEKEPVTEEPCSTLATAVCSTCGRANCYEHGFIISLVYNSSLRKSYLLVLDAHSFQELYRFV